MRANVFRRHATQRGSRRRFAGESGGSEGDQLVPLRMREGRAFPSLTTSSSDGIWARSTHRPDSPATLTATSGSGVGRRPIGAHSPAASSLGTQHRAPATTSAETPTPAVGAALTTFSIYPTLMSWQGSHRPPARLTPRTSAAGCAHACGTTASRQAAGQGSGTRRSVVGIWPALALPASWRSLFPHRCR
jgi:hypothetical protein